MNKKKDKIKIHFIGNASCGVTGSCFLVETPNYNLLLEVGITQSSNFLDDFRENSKPFPFKVKNIDYVFLLHAHADHIANSGKLVNDGFEGRFITTEITKKIMKPMLLDCANINRKDAEYLTRKKGRQVYPTHTEDDVHNVIDKTDTYDYDIMYELNEEISFRFLKNSHIIGASQLELFVKESSSHTSKILYTSDLGSVKKMNHYVSDFEKCKTANVVISEATYGAGVKGSKPDRKKDLERIQTTIEKTCIEQKGRLLMPCFALARCQQLMTDLYLLYKDDNSFNIPIYVDSPLIWEVCKAYRESLDGENLQLFEDVCNWKNIHFIKDFKESQIVVADKSPKICLSSSGFLLRGRSVNYLKEYIKHISDGILITGYCPPNSIAGKIKSNQKNITIEGVTYKNKCGLTVLSSYSSHIQQNELLNYLKGINCDRIYLVHSEETVKNEFKTLLEEEYKKLNKTVRVIATTKGTVCNL